MKNLQLKTVDPFKQLTAIAVGGRFSEVTSGEEPLGLADELLYNGTVSVGRV